MSPPIPRADQALVRVASAGVNPSDVKAMLGLMPQAVFPRTPGRDFAGTVVDGPAEWIGKEVWGSGGDLGITRDGSHAGWLLLPAAALRAKPARLSFDEAGAVGVPFVTAYEGFRRSGLPQRGQAVAVLGANGKVGQAAVQLAMPPPARRGLRCAAAGGRLPDGHAAAPVTTVDARGGDVGARLRDLTGGRGVDIAFNTVGSPYFEAANKALAKGGTQVFISTVERPVPFDIFAFYRGMHTFVGIDSLASSTPRPARQPVGGHDRRLRERHLAAVQGRGRRRPSARRRARRLPPRDCRRHLPHRAAALIANNTKRTNEETR